MGSGLRVVLRAARPLPVQTGSTPRPRRVPMISRERGGTGATRYLVTVFLADQPGLLAALLKTFDDGVRVATPALSQERRIRFSIDGSLSSSVLGSFLLAFVVRPVLREGENASARVEKLYQARIPDLLSDEICRRLSSLTGQSEVSLENQVRVVPFRGPGDELFARRRFTEYRFGFPSQASDAGWRA